MKDALKALREAAADEAQARAEHEAYLDLFRRGGDLRFTYRGCEAYDELEKARRRRREAETMYRSGVMRREEGRKF